MLFILKNNILEIGETQSAVIARLLGSGMTAEETAAKTRLPISANFLIVL